MNCISKNVVEIKHFHLYCGIGGGAIGFNRANVRVGTMHAKFRCLGGVDVDASAIRVFNRETGSKGTVLDMFSREQYVAFHGKQPKPEWTEATTADIHRAAGNERPHIIFLSAPCKGYSGLLSESKSKSAKYRALNELTLRGVWLSLEAYKDDPVEMYAFENVPRIATRGGDLLDQIEALFLAYGYAVARTNHDCGELGGLAQSRKRFLLVARHCKKVPACLYEPPKKPLRAVGEILSRMPLPGDESAGPMHRIPKLQWKTWVRLAFVEAGKDWRSLQNLQVEDGFLKDYLIVPEYRAGYLGVNRWDEHTGTIASRSTPSNGNFSIADPRFEASTKWTNGQAYGVRKWDEKSGAITGQQSPGQGAFSVADPRGSGFAGKYTVTRFDEYSNTVISGSTTGQGAFAVSDPRIELGREHPFGVVPWNSPAGTVSGKGRYDNGKYSVADPRLPNATNKLVAIIQALDGTWHRPFTTLELAALQSLVNPDNKNIFILDGDNDSVWREHIGNMVPPDAAQAMAEAFGETLLLAWAGESFVLSSTPLWVRPIAVALSVNQPEFI
jgi:site-specific DNA-cytosine methylase